MANLTHIPSMTVGAVLEHKYATLREKIAAEKEARMTRYEKFEAVYNKANTAGHAAGVAAIPTPMTVGEPTTFFGNDIDPSKPVYHVPEGPCGFAWVVIRPATTSFARWLVKNKLGRKGYGGGVHIWISAHGQSIERKEAHARVMAHVLTTELGVKAYANSRMD